MGNGSTLLCTSYLAGPTQNSGSEATVSASPTPAVPLALTQEHPPTLSKKDAMLVSSVLITHQLVVLFLGSVGQALAYHLH